MTNGLVFLINILFSLYVYVIMLRILLELVGADYYHPVCQFVLSLTDKSVSVLKKILPRLRKFDLPAVVLMVAVQVIKLLLLILLSSFSISVAMFFVVALVQLIDQLFSLYIFMIIVFAALSWVHSPNTAVLISLLYKLLDPILKPIRKVLPLIGNVDLSPLVAIIILYFLRIAIVAPILAKAWMLNT